ncbi:hypothetical protein FOZ63_027767 [Perkinsus olseni]|uniref:Uncharacterized protein n=1 Tax=Perkinsus olseni TaxID=32597 RepID=A0A7J6QTQ2_PEROL|nr:hypothetical protein FOZ63_027767 [Perkinsus olseni]
MPRRQSSCTVDDDLIEGPVANFSHRGLVSMPALDFRTSLVGLYLQNNKLTGELPHLGKLPYLRDLDLSDNLLSALPEYSLEGCSALARVSLANNHWLVSVHGLHEVRRTLKALDLSCCPNLSNMWPVGFSLNLSVLLCNTGDLSEVQEYVCHVQPRGIGRQEKWLHWGKALGPADQLWQEREAGYHYDTCEEPDVTPRVRNFCVKTAGGNPSRCTENRFCAEYHASMDWDYDQRGGKAVDCHASADSWDLEDYKGNLSYRREVEPILHSEVSGRRGFEHERLRTVADARYYMQGISRSRAHPVHRLSDRRDPRPPLVEVSRWEEEYSDRVYRGGTDLAAAVSCERNRRCLIFAARVGEVCSATQYRDKVAALATLTDDLRRPRRVSTSSHASYPGAVKASEVLGPLDNPVHAYEPAYQNSEKSGSSLFEDSSPTTQGVVVHHHHVREVDVEQVDAEGFDRGGHYDSRERMSIREGNGWEKGRSPVARHGSSLMERASGVEVSDGEGHNRRATVGGWGDRRSIEVLPSQGRRHSGGGHIGAPSSEGRPQDGAGMLQRPTRKCFASDRGSVTERIREVVPGRQGRPEQVYAHEGWEGSSSGRPSRSGSVEVLPSRGRSSIEVISGREETRRPEVLADKGSAGMPDYHHYHERIEISSGAKQLVRDESVDISRVVEAAPLEESILVEEAPPPLVGPNTRPVEDDGYMELRRPMDRPRTRQCI